MTLPDGTAVRHTGTAPGPRARMRIHDWQVLDNLAQRGDLGWGEDYAAGLWDSDDLPTLMHFVAANAADLFTLGNGKALFRLSLRLKRLLLGNSPTRSRKNVHDHYDLGNAFYREWLDDTMTYSCALFGGDPSLSLEAAQHAKYVRILNRLQIRTGDRAVEIGCGWGGFMEEAAKQNFRVTGLTLSDEQAAFVRARLPHADVRLEDYRAHTGAYDHLVSIGMFEHVGEAYWKAYMDRVRAFLKKGGGAMIQTILIREDLFDLYRASSGFIREHIFPGGMLPTRPRFEAEARKADLAVRDVFHFGRDYAITLQKWLERFDHALPRIRALGFDDAFIRKWRFYLAYCCGMFRAGVIDVMQVHLEKPV